MLTAIYQQVEQGHIRLDESVELTGDLKVPGSGVRKEMAPGIRLTLRDLAMLMIVTSDNTATDVIYNRVVRDNLQKTLHCLGTVNTSILMNTRDLLYNIVGLDPWDTSIMWREVQGKLRNQELVLDADGLLEKTSDVCPPAEVSYLLELTQGRQVANSAVCEDMLNILKRQQLTEMLPRKLPAPGPLVAHKAGGYHGVRCDVELVYAPNGPYTVAIMAKQITDMVEVQHAIASFSRAIYGAVCERRVEPSPKSSLRVWSPEGASSRHFPGNSGAFSSRMTNYL